MKRIPVRIVSTQDEKVLQVRFFPTDICNFNCSYCWPGSGNIGKYRYPTNIDTIIDNFRFLFDLYNQQLQKDKFHIILAGGGEPTLWPYIEEFCQKIKKKHNVYTTIVTNGSRSLRWWKENLKYFDDVVLSTHHEFVDIDHQCSVGDLLYESDIKITAQILMDAKNWGKCIGIVDRMKNSHYPWMIETKSIVDAPGYGIDIYDQDQLEYLKISIKRIPDGDWILKRLIDMRPVESVVLFNDGTAISARADNIIINKYNYFYGWSCNVALETLVILYDGSVKGSCQEPVFKNQNLNLFSETFKTDFLPNFKITPIRCPRIQCNCQPETHVSKQKL